MKPTLRMLALVGRYLPGILVALVFAVGLAIESEGADADRISVLLIDGQNNHKWQETTPLIKQVLEGCGRFTVAVATSPAKGGDMAEFAPKFSDYQVVVSNYNGQPWSEKTQQAFERYVAGGGASSVFMRLTTRFRSGRLTTA